MAILEAALSEWTARGRVVIESNIPMNKNTITALLVATAFNVSRAADLFPFLADRPNSPEAVAASIASSSSSFIRYLDFPKNLTSIRVYLSVYRKGAAEPPIGLGAATSGDIAHRRLAISASVRSQESRQYLPGKPCTEALVRGTGSTYIGLSFLAFTSGSGHSGSGVQKIIQHRELEMLGIVGPLDVSKLPFSLETRATVEDHAIPVFMWLPGTFEPKTAPNKLTAKDLPDGTIVAYVVTNEKS